MIQSRLVSLSSVVDHFSPAASNRITAGKWALGDPIRFSLKSDALFHAYCSVCGSRPEGFELVELDYECGDAVGASPYDVSIEPVYMIDPFVGAELYLKYSRCNLTQFSDEVIQKAAAFDEVVVPEFVEKQVKLSEPVLGTPHCAKFKETRAELGNDFNKYLWVTRSEYDQIIAATVKALKIPQNELPDEFFTARVARR